MNISKIA